MDFLHGQRLGAARLRPQQRQPEAGDEVLELQEPAVFVLFRREC